MMGSLKALQEWCRIQCENYNDVEIKNMSTSFRDGLAFCAIIHRYRPDLIDFDSLSKENVYENNRLAFEVAEAELGIPALLDPEDMVSMKVPDRLSIITYVSQYYNFFTNKSQVPGMKRASGAGHSEPAQKRHVAEDKVVEPELNTPGQTGRDGALAALAKRYTLSSTCAACQKHVHLVQRFLVDGKLYHRNCFRCRECSSTLLPGSYKLGNETGSLVCSHHFARSALANQNGRPDLSKRPEIGKKPTGIQSVRIGRSTPPQTPPSVRAQEKTPPQEGVVVVDDHSTPANDSTTPTPVSTSQTDSLEKEKEWATPPVVVGDHSTPANDSTTPTPVSTSQTDSLEKEKEWATPPVVVGDHSTPANDSTTPTPVSTSQTDSLEKEKEWATPPVVVGDHSTPANDSTTPTPVSTSQTDSLEKEKEREDSRDTEVEEKEGEKLEVEPPPSTPPNPFDESDEEEEKEEETPKPAKDTANGGLPSTPVSHLVEDRKPVPAPRRVVDPSPPPRPAPRVRPPRVTDSLAINGDPGDHRRSIPAPRPRDRSHSPGSSSLSSNTPKPKDPPWLALVQSDPKKKPAPPPPPGTATPPHKGSLSSLKGAGTRPATPPPPANPFDDDDDEVEEEGEGPAGGEAPPTAAAVHPWYSITQAAEAAGPDTPPSGGSSSHSASPRGGRNKTKRPAPRAPQPPNSHSAYPHSQPSSSSPSSSPSPAVSTESLSSASDHSSSHPPLGGGVSGVQDHPFTKSVSEPSICGPSDSTPSSSSAERLPRLSPSPSPPPPPANTSSAPATPQTIRSTRPPPPRPPTTPSPLAAAAGAHAPSTPPSHGKRTCKENPFNRKASPSAVSPKTRPPRGPRPARPPAPGHGFPLIKRKVQSDVYIPVEDIHVEMGELEKQLDELEQRGVELEKKLRDSPNDEEEEHLLVDWFTLIHEKQLLVRREAHLVYTAKQQNLEERQADVEYELRCLLNKPEKDWSEEDKGREQELMAELVTIIEQRNQIINNMDQDRQREEEEDKLLAAMLKKKDFQKEPESEHKKKGGKFKPMKVLKRLSHKNEGGKEKSPRKEKS